MNITGNRMWRYGIAVVFIMVAFFLREALVILFGAELPHWITCYPTVMCVSLMAGLGPGILATVTAALLVDYFVIPPPGSFGIASPGDWLNLTVFCGMGLFMSVVAERYRRGRDRLEELVQERTGELCQANDGLRAEVEERKRAEAALRESEERFRLFMDNSSTIAWIKDEEGWYVYLSRACEQRFGVRLADWRGKTDAELWPPDIAAEFRKNDLAVLAANQPMQVTEETFNPDGSRCSWLSIKFPFRDAAGRRYVAGIGLDITARRQAEEELRRAHDELEKKVYERTMELREKDQMLIMQSRQAAMGEMTGNIAHQWRQPLNSVGMIMQTLTLMHDAGELNRESLVAMECQVMELISHMSRTIDDFRNFFRSDKEKAEFSVLRAVENTVSLVEASFKDRFINTEIVMEEDPVITGYQNEYSQALLNILQNARDAFESREIVDPRVSIGIRRVNGRSVVTIADNAGGIPAEIMHKIFDPYFTTKGPDKGTGIGLFMAKAIIEKNMGGRLTVSNTGDGAEFRVEV